MREANLALPPSARSKFAQLAELLSQASLVAAEISRNYGNTRLHIPELKRPKNVSEDQEWFWSKEWQAGEKRVNQELENGEYQVFDNMDDAIAELHRHV